jgi:NitT/TauT family transport system substrate-binding protein
MAEPEAQARLTPVGKIISILLILGLIGLGAYLVLEKTDWLSKPKAGTGTAATVPAGGAEAPDTKSITTQKDYAFIPAQKLAPVKGVSKYKWDDKEKILRFSYNVWAGWLPVIAANHGTKANEDSIFFKKYGFRVEMKLMDDPVAARDAFAAGEVQTLWGTVDMMILFAPELTRDSRSAPRIVQQIDWSNGGDGIVVRSSIRSVADLKGKTIAYALNSPSEYYLTSLLLSAGLKPADIKPKLTATAFEASAAFVADNSIDGCVSWAPDIYRIPENVKGTRILSSTSDANKLIADVYALRADFVQDHPEVVKGLVAGIFEGMDLVKANPTQACQWMADAFGMKSEEVKGMMNDAHPTNFQENVQFFLNANNPTNFERTWKSAGLVYRTLGRISAPVDFDQVMDFTFVQDLQKAGTFANQKDESVTSFTSAGAYKSVQAEKPILTQTIRINFFPNSANPYEPARDDLNNIIPGKLYDPGVDATIERVSRLVGQFARAVVKIEGHTDSSMKGRVPVQEVKTLSLARAEAIKQALIQKYKFDPNKFVVVGLGWDEPADPADPNNQALNRRVEINVYPPEQQ